MSGNGKGRWDIKWLDRQTFKVEKENDSLTEQCIQDFAAWLDAQLQEQFGAAVPRVTARTINFSGCGLDNGAVQRLLEYLYSRDIAVQTLKLFRNDISDAGAWAVGQFLAHASLPVQEVHLSHNALTEQGACSLLESIVWSGRYPFFAEGGRRDREGQAPVWLRVEHNCIDWDAIDHRLNRHQMTWSTAESRDGWQMQERAPSVCLHSSFRKQHDKTGRDWDWEPMEAAHLSVDASVPSQGGAPCDGSFLLAALRGDGAAKESLNSQLGTEGQQPLGGAAEGQWRAGYEAQLAPQEAVAPVAASAGSQWGGGAPPPQPQPASAAPAVAPAQLAEGDAEGVRGEAAEEVPLYTFLDADTVRQMLTREDGLLRFRGLANLCAQGHMKCAPQDERELPAWVGPVEEQDCIMFAITDTVMDELAEKSSTDPILLRELERFRAQDPSCVLMQCLDWGILEVLETSLHTQMMRLTGQHEARAKDLQVSQRSLKMLDFVCLWQSQIESEGRVLLVTEDFRLRQFGGEVTSVGPRKQWPSVLMLGEFNQLLSQDAVLGGQKLTQASLQPHSLRQYCGAVLSGPLLAKVAAGRSWTTNLEANCRPGPSDAFPVLRQELHEAVAAITKALRLMRDGVSVGVSVSDQAAQAARMETALARWQTLLGQVY